MINILTVSTEPSKFSVVTDYLNRQGGIHLLHARVGAEALDLIDKNAVTLVIADEDMHDMTGLEFARRLLSADPQIYCALASSLGSDAFHEASEGLGVLTQLPVSPVESDGEELLTKLRHVIKLNQIPEPSQ